MLWILNRELPVATIPPVMGKWRTFIKECTEDYLAKGKAHYLSHVARLNEEAYSKSPEHKARQEALIAKLSAEESAWNRLTVQVNEMDFDELLKPE
jgi:hypothetical protein